MNYRDFLQKVIYAIINPLIKAMIAVGITPNIVTFVGFLGNIVAAGFFLDAAWMLGTEQADYASCMVTVGWGWIHYPCSRSLRYDGWSSGTYERQK